MTSIEKSVHHKYIIMIDRRSTKLLRFKQLLTLYTGAQNYDIAGHLGHFIHLCVFSDHVHLPVSVLYSDYTKLQSLY